MKRLLYFLLCYIVLGLVACGPTDAILVVPDTYDFENVSYQKQMDQISMLQQLSNYAKSANIPFSPELSLTQMRNMYENTNKPFDNNALNSSRESLKDNINLNGNTHDFFSRCFTQLSHLSEHTNRTASPGSSGIATSLDGTKTYLLTANGLELAQLIEKGLASACMYHQAVTIYLGYVKMNVDNKAVLAGKGTLMQHNWDQAFGYLGAPKDFPSNTTDLKLWAKYINKVSLVLGSSTRLTNAFRTGRAAININDYVERDRQINIIRQEWELVLAAVAISYLNDAKRVSNDPALYCHYLTEAYAFLMGIKYGYARDASKDAQINTILETLADNNDPLLANFYATTITDIDNTTNAVINLYSKLSDVRTAL